MKPVVLITGISSPVGLACGRLFSQEGFRVCGSDAGLSPRIRCLAEVWGGRVLERGDARTNVQKIVDEFGRVDALVACTAISNDLDEALRVALKDTFNHAAAVEAPFKKAHGGKIVTIAPNEAKAPPHVFAVRQAILGFTHACARELGRHNVNVNAVAPELFIAEPDDIAGVAHFLCTEEARHITGEVIYINGGIPQ